MSPTHTHPERIVPDETEAGIVAIHLKRYEFARPHCAGKLVLDAACGVGYGSDFLAATAASVVGVELDDEAIEYANRRYLSENARFVQGDVSALPFAASSFDVVCSFETIEHVADPERTLSEFARVLRPDGELYISTPNAATTTTAPANPHHRVEWSRDDFRSLLEGFFGTVDLYGQRRAQSAAHYLLQRLDVLGVRRRLSGLRRGARLLGTAPMAELSLADILIDSSFLDRASEIVAVCRLPRA